MKTARILLSLVCVMGGIWHANAQYGSENVGTDTVMNATSSSGTFTFPQFNPDLGTLGFVVFQITGVSCVIDWYGYNETAAPVDFNAPTMFFINQIIGPQGVSELQNSPVYEFDNSVPVQLNPTPYTSFGDSGSYMINFPAGGMAGSAVDPSLIGTGSITFTLNQDIDPQGFIEGYPYYIGYTPTVDNSSINETISLTYDYMTAPEPSALDFAGLGAACLVFYTLTRKRFNVLKSGRP